MDIKERLLENEQKIKQITASVQQLQQDSQNLLQELLRLDGEHRLLLDLQTEEGKGSIDK